MFFSIIHDRGANCIANRIYKFAYVFVNDLISKAKRSPQSIINQGRSSFEAWNNIR